MLYCVIYFLNVFLLTFLFSIASFISKVPLVENGNFISKIDVLLIKPTRNIGTYDLLDNF